MDTIMLIAALVYGSSVVATIACGIAARYSPQFRRQLIGETPSASTAKD